MTGCPSCGLSRRSLPHRYCQHPSNHRPRNGRQVIVEPRTPSTNRQWRTEVKRRDARIKEVEDRLKKVLILCEQYETNCDPTSTQAQVAELFRQAAED